MTDFPKRCRCCKTIVDDVSEALRHRRDCVCVSLTTSGVIGGWEQLNGRWKPMPKKLKYPSFRRKTVE